MRWSRWIDPTFAVDLLLLALAAPALYFPGWFPAWAPYASLGVLAAGWVWRRRRLGVWYAPTPADWPIFFLFAVMLPVAILAAPGPPREQYSIPRAYVLLWNFCLFWTIVTHSSRSYQSAEWALGGFALSALLIALIAPLGMNWLYKFPGAEKALSAIPAPLLGIFSGAESGFHPNQVAGTLLYAFPLLLAVTVADVVHRRRTLASRLVSWLVWASTPVVGLILLVTQSRSALLGLAVGVTVMALINRLWGRWLLLVVVVASVIGLPFYALSVFTAINDAASEHAAAVLTDTRTLAFRLEVWTQAIDYIGRFPFTGIGLGTFRRLMWVLGPTGIYYTVDIGHAHNFFLQGALDFGLAGLVAIVAIHLMAVVQVAAVWRRTRRQGDGGREQSDARRALFYCAIGFAGSLVAQSIVGGLDAVALGAKTNFAFWYLLALIFGTANYLDWLLRAEDASSIRAAEVLSQSGRLSTTL